MGIYANISNIIKSSLVPTEHGMPNLTAYYNYLVQLVPVYEIIERKLLKHYNVATFPEQISYLLQRSIKLRNDLSFLRRYVVVGSPSLPNEYTEVTRDYMHHLDLISQCPSFGGFRLLGHFLMLTLSDLACSDEIKKQLTRLYVKSGVSIYHVDKGLSLYDFDASSAATLAAYLENMQISPEEEYELENSAMKARDHLLAMKQFAHLSQREASGLNAKACCRFFMSVDRRKMLEVGTYGALAAVGGLLTAQAMLRSYLK